MIVLGILSCVSLANGGHGGSSEEGAGTSGASKIAQAMQFLEEGNMRFVVGACQNPHQDEARRKQTSRQGQKPVVTILTCADSRVPPEIIFDAGIGDLFIIRVAGNVADKAEIGSIEYGVGHLGTKLVVVMGHTKCGAVTAVVQKAEVGGNLPGIVDNIAPAVTKARAMYRGATEPDLIEKSIKLNVWQSIEDMFKASAELREKVRMGEVKVVGAIYDITTGKVTFLGIHYQQGDLIKK
jgi:carbonic anhydrase